MRNQAARSGVALLFVLSMGIYIFAQAPAQKAAGGKPPGNLPGTFTFIPKGDVEKVQKAILNGTPNDAPVRMVNANRFDFGVYTLHYAEPSKPRPAGAPVNGWYHNDIAELYYFASGAGSWRVGGELENPKADDVNGRSVKEVRGPGVVGVLKGYTDQKFKAGDALIVPPGVPHSPGEMTEPTTIIRFVLDPNRVLPLRPAAAQAPTPTPRKTTGNPAPKLPGTFTFISKAEIDKVLKEIEDVPGPSGDRPVRTVDLANMNYRLGVYVLRTAQMPKKSEAAAAGWYHTNIAEAYYFLRGTGTFTIGGSLENPVADDPNAWSTKMVRGPSVSGAFKGATELKIEPGDIIIAPTGVPHRPSQTLSVPRDILRIAIDPDKVLPLK